MAALIYELKTRPQIEWTLCSTGQHKSMLAQTFADLDFEPHIDLGLMDQAEGLPAVTAAAVQKVYEVVGDTSPDWVLVQGDTTTAMASALAAYYQKVPVGHVEAGLRTGSRYSPWPEEINRRMISAIATRHFAPTATARQNLLDENIPAQDILITGNTVIDVLLRMSARIDGDAGLRTRLEAAFDWLDAGKRIVLVTGHRRENFGPGLEQICGALALIADRGDVDIVYPVHLNPNVRDAVQSILGGRRNIHLIEPQPYAKFVYLMKRSTLILTDSGGIQEEAPSLGKPVLVMRDTTERPEAVAAGACRLVGTRSETIVSMVNRLLDDATDYAAMSRCTNPYGDGTAGRKIIGDLAS